MFLKRLAVGVPIGLRFCKPVRSRLVIGIVRQGRLFELIYLLLDSKQFLCGRNPIQ